MTMSGGNRCFPRVIVKNQAYRSRTPRFLGFKCLHQGLSRYWLARSRLLTEVRGRMCSTYPADARRWDSCVKLFLIYAFKTFNVEKTGSLVDKTMTIMIKLASHVILHWSRPFFKCWKYHDHIMLFERTLVTWIDWLRATLVLLQIRGPASSYIMSDYINRIHVKYYRSFVGLQHVFWAIPVRTGIKPKVFSRTWL